MSEATDRPTDDDAWARACAEDLAAEKERLRGQGGERPTGTAAEELFKLFEAVADKVAGLNNPLMGAAAQGAVRQFVNQAKTAAKPVVERNPEVFDHLAAAGSELLAAYRSAVEGHERRWTSDTPPAQRRPDRQPPERDPRDEGPDDGPAERIDLD
ncbi:DUF5304 domain-containing protein [Streptomyces xanthophaeus]|uniref:DUF5304 domain-containing protein n=1 Tax=Streptomyces xanthophaeus TaxID=67385 RepID=A0A919H492_9ACTN|nr:DUF5304 domain-containing protein [Streptomyces xanthophaeus]WCD86033.1 hypothetical protein KPP03845_102375 [Streptomyces xanthophaeus]WST22111.1 DUF5304 domain-containing protein [Streptomyces xanthophaeus]WST62915.1 DUF5304 domain-containing protein [Streptomyces xanthophaeus]GHI90115.1 hypothetical protein Sxan_74790 [Streptomyces xanthophaeus]